LIDLVPLNSALRSLENWVIVVSIPQRHSGILMRLMAPGNRSYGCLQLNDCHVEAHELSPCVDGDVEMWGVAEKVLTFGSKETQSRGRTTLMNTGVVATGGESRILTLV
jgi:hypothetical protein